MNQGAVWNTIQVNDGGQAIVAGGELGRGTRGHIAGEDDDK